MDEGNSGICCVAARPYNSPASAEPPTGALNITQRYHALHEYARIYHALAAREVKGSERKFILLCLAEEADMRVERVESSLRKFRAQSPSGNAVSLPDPLDSTALAD